MTDSAKCTLDHFTWTESSIKEGCIKGHINDLQNIYYPFPPKASVISCQLNTKGTWGETRTQNTFTDISLALHMMFSLVFISIFEQYVWNNHSKNTTFNSKDYMWWWHSEFLKSPVFCAFQNIPSCKFPDYSLYYETELNDWKWSNNSRLSTLTDIDFLCHLDKFSKG